MIERSFGEFYRVLINPAVSKFGFISVSFCEINKEVFSVFLQDSPRTHIVEEFLFSRIIWASSGKDLIIS